MNGQYLPSTGSKSIRVGLIVHGSSFNETDLVAKDSLKLNITISTLLIMLNTIWYYFPHPLHAYFSLSLFFVTLVAPNKEFLNLKLLVGFFDQASKS